jgi:hypothetical protein
MAKIFWLLIAYGCLSTLALAAEKLTPGQIVPRFYELLTQDASPSQADELAFFGDPQSGSDGGVRALLVARTKTISSTPIWDFLRQHKTLFLTKHLSQRNIYPSEPGLQISDPFRFFRPSKGNYRPELRVLVNFPEEQQTEHAFGGSSLALFILGEDCYLDIAATTVIRQRPMILYEAIYSKNVD